jgi:hypothetical protein
MKGAFFSKPLEWNIETQGESWTQGSPIPGRLSVKNHGSDPVDLSACGVGLAYAEIKKIHARTQGALKFESQKGFEQTQLPPGETLSLDFALTLAANSPVTDKKATYFLAYGKGFEENHLQLKIEPRPLFSKIVGLLDTFHRFKLKEIKTAKNGVEFKLIPPTARDMANLDGLSLIFSMEQDTLLMDFEFQIKKLDTSSITTKVSKETSKLRKTLTPKEYSLGKEMINQDGILRALEDVLKEVKIKSVF